jgi:hypothetical protein
MEAKEIKVVMEAKEGMVGTAVPVAKDSDETLEEEEGLRLPSNRPTLARLRRGYDVEEGNRNVQWSGIFHFVHARLYGESKPKKNN